MSNVFGELRKLPCWYCKYYYSITPDCLKRSLDVDGDGEYPICENISFDMEKVLEGIDDYYNYLNSIKK